MTSGRTVKWILPVLDAPILSWCAGLERAGLEAIPRPCAFSRRPRDAPLHTYPGLSIDQGPPIPTSSPRDTSPVSAAVSVSTARHTAMLPSSHFNHGVPAGWEKKGLLPYLHLLRRYLHLPRIPLPNGRDGGGNERVHLSLTTIFVFYTTSLSVFQRMISPRFTVLF